MADLKYYSIASTAGSLRIISTTAEKLDKVVAGLAADQFGVQADTLREIESSDIPADSDRDFRDAWEDTGSAISVNMDKARTVFLSKIRRVRNAELVKKDVDYIRAIEANDGTASDVATAKQTLRDLPATTDLSGASTPTELRALWPSELPDE